MFFSKVSSSKRYKFVPQKDITAYELARILPYLVSRFTNIQKDIEEGKLDDVIRHLKEIEEK